jgi:general secretion pathway protein F
LREGKAFSATLEEAPHSFPPLYAATLRASERTSGLGEALSRYIAYASQLETLRGRLISAAIYPLLLVVVGDAGHSVSARLCRAALLAHLSRTWAAICRCCRDCCWSGAWRWSATGRCCSAWWRHCWGWPCRSGCDTGWHSACSRLLWRIPAVGERMRVFQLTRLYRTLGMLLLGGIAVVPALEMVSGLLSAALQPRLDSATQAIREGRGISQAFEAGGLTTAVALRMLQGRRACRQHGRNDGAHRGLSR